MQTIYKSLFVILLGLLLPAISIAVESEDKREKLIQALHELQYTTDVSDDYAAYLVQLMTQGLVESGVEMEREVYAEFSTAIEDAVREEFIESGDLESLLTTNLQSFTTSELGQLLDFYKTPLGAKFLQWSPQVTQNNLVRAAQLQEMVGLRLLSKLLDGGNGSELNLLSMLLGENTKLDPNIAFDIDPDLPSEAELQELAAGKCNRENKSGKRIPIYRDTPIYPYEARRFGIEGWVELSFKLSTAGQPQTITIDRSPPGTIFNQAAIDAVESYRYCQGEQEEQSAIRIRFELEGERNQEDDKSNTKELTREQGLRSPKTKGKGAFMQTANFAKSMEKYIGKHARKAFAVADDGRQNVRWTWYYGYRTQDEANAAALNQCASRRSKAGIKSHCEIFMYGNQVSEKYASNQSLGALLAPMIDENYQVNSHYEESMLKYADLSSAKAMAISENENGAYYHRFAAGWRTQDDANKSALKACNADKGEKMKNDCELFMVGDYPMGEIPRLSSLAGIWEGLLQNQSIDGTAKSGPAEAFNIRFENCSGVPKISLMAPGAQEAQVIGRLFDVSESKGNIVLSSIARGKGWVETQVWGFIELDSQNAVVQRNRMVSNIGLDLDQELRDFGSLGAGTLSKTEECALP